MVGSNFRISRKSIQCISLTFITFISTTFFLPVYSLAGQVTAAWDPNNEPNVTGYIVYWGIASRQYTDSVDVGNQTEYTISALDDGQTYYFSVTAYDNFDVESNYSEEVSVIVNAAGSSCASDFNQDGIVNFEDLAILKANMFSTCPLGASCLGDANDDGTVNFNDLALLKAEFFRTDCH